MTTIGKLTLGILNNDKSQNIAIQEIVDKLNLLITDHNAEPDSIGGGTQGPQGPPGPQGPIGPPGVPGPKYSRENTTLVTGSLAPGAWERGSFVWMLRGDLLVIQPDKPTRVIFYSTAAAQTADIGRGLGTPAPLGQGILGEFAFGSAYAITTSPIPRITNNDIPANEVIYYSVMNRSLSSGPVSVALRADHVPLT